MPITFGVLPGHGDSGDPLGTAELVEALGYDSVWVGDHVLWYTPSPDPAVLLGAMAARTTRVRLGTAVMLAALRPAVVVAKQAATLDLISGGRFILGVGAGGENPQEFESSGIDVHQRGARLDETLEVVRALWRQPSVTFAGRHITLRDARFDLPTTTPGGPPIWVGGRSAAALRRAGRFGDGWLAFVVTAERFAESWRSVQAHCLAADRDPSALTPALQLWCQFDDDPAAATAVLASAIEAMYRIPYARFERYCVAGGAERWVDRLSQFAAAGVQHFNLVLAGGDVLTQLVRIAEDVLPAVAARTP